MGMTVTVVGKATQGTARHPNTSRRRTRVSSRTTQTQMRAITDNSSDEGLRTPTPTKDGRGENSSSGGNNEGDEGNEGGEDGEEMMFGLPKERVFKPFAILLASQFILFIGVGALLPALPLYAQSIGLDGRGAVQVTSCESTETHSLGKRLFPQPLKLQHKVMKTPGFLKVCSFIWVHLCAALRGGTANGIVLSAPALAMLALNLPAGRLVDSWVGLAPIAPSPPGVEPPRVLTRTAPPRAFHI
jgi:hypothetical protein